MGALVVGDFDVGRVVVGGVGAAVTSGVGCKVGWLVETASINE